MPCIHSHPFLFCSHVIGSVGPASTPRYIFAPTLLSAVEGVKGMYPLLDTIMLFCSSTVICSTVEGVKSLYPLQYIGFLPFQNDICSEGSEKPVSTHRYCYYASPCTVTCSGRSEKPVSTPRY